MAMDRKGFKRSFVRIRSMVSVQGTNSLDRVLKNAMRAREKIVCSSNSFLAGLREIFWEQQEKITGKTFFWSIVYQRVVGKDEELFDGHSTKEGLGWVWVVKGVSGPKADASNSQQITAGENAQIFLLMF